MKTRSFSTSPITDDYLGDHGLWCKGLPSFLSCYHVPAIVKMPGGHWQGVVRDEFVSALRLRADVARDEFSGEPLWSSRGASLMPLLEGETPADWRDAPFFAPWHQDAGAYVEEADPHFPHGVVALVHC